MNYIGNYLKKNFPQGRHVILKGNVTRRGSELMMSQPKVLSKEDYECDRADFEYEDHKYSY